jgi:hypothetical protein
MMEVGYTRQIQIAAKHMINPQLENTESSLLQQHVRRKSKIRTFKILAVTLAILAPIVSSILGGYSAWVYGDRNYHGDLVQWQSLGSPPGKAAKIVGTCQGDICVETSNKSIYSANQQTCLEPSPSCWQELEPSVKIWPLIYDETCSFEFNVANPPAGVVESITSKICDSGGDRQTNYALHADGSVSIWTHTVNDVYGLEVLASVIRDTMVYLVIGLVISTGIALVVLIAWISQII